MGRVKNVKAYPSIVDREVKTDDILNFLNNKYNGSDTRGEWVGFAEFRPGTGFAACSDRYIDFWAINCFSSQNYQKISYEIKQSRSDFMSEIKNPEKRKMALLISNLFYFAAPAGLIKPEDLPPEAGLIEFYWKHNQSCIDDRLSHNRLIDEANKLEERPNWNDPLSRYYHSKPYTIPQYKEELVSVKTVKDPIREHMVPGWKFIAAVCRRVQQQNKANGSV